MKRRYVFRAYPTTRQQRGLRRLFGCCRYIYNSVIADRQMTFETRLHAVEESRPTQGNPDRTVRSFDANRQAALITYERTRKPWLNDVSSVALIQSMRDAEQAFSNFFASVSGNRKRPRVGFPRFKSRFTGKQSARFTSNGFRVDGDRVFIAKIGWVRFVRSRALPSTPSSVTIIHKPDQTFEVSFVVEVAPVDLAPAIERHAGIDAGLDTFAAVVYSDGTREKVDNPRFFRRQHRRLRKAQRDLSRKQGPDRRTGKKPSKGWRTQQARIARLHSGVVHTRTDFARKLARRLASENTTIAIESLNIRGLARSGGHDAQGRGLRRSIHDAAWGAFFANLANVAGSRLLAVDPAHTSQTCGVCGVVDGPKPLSVRKWECQACGAVLDRDWNAALNVMIAAGQAEISNAGGGDFRLQLAEAVAKEAGTRWSAGEVAASTPATLSGKPKNPAASAARRKSTGGPA
ncbi:RNA-guided endonuclease InsQ/TnpB family protein [Microbacterium maritypicum]|nr:RNA-guided endonuclease TnpB family protein [Microbacterium liquefaciens]